MSNYLDNLSPELAVKTLANIEARGIKTNIIIEEDFNLVKLEELEDEDDLSLCMAKLAINKANPKPFIPGNVHGNAALWGEINQLTELGAKYEQEFIVRGHQALYELLASIYSLALRIESDQNAVSIKGDIRTQLKDTLDIKVQAKANAMQMLVKFIIRTDKMSASRYAKVLDVAYQDGVPPADFPAYVARRGGIANIQDTEAKQVAKKEGGNLDKERLGLIRKYFENERFLSENTFTYSGDTTLFNAEKETSAEQSSFAIFIADYEGNSQYRVISANDFGKTFEDTILRFIGKSFPEDIAVLERGIRQQMQKIARNELLAPELRTNFKRLANEPMKFQASVVIDQEVHSKEGGN